MSVPYQASDSTQRGFVAPVADPFSLDTPGLGLDQGIFDPKPKSGQDLDNFFQQMVAGIVALDGTLVRPRFQAEPPELPDFGINWAAVGVMRRTPMGPWATIGHDPRGEGRSWMQRHEYLDVLSSFYGPDADDNCGLLQDGLSIAQNREPLQLNGMGLIDIGNPVHAPALIKGRWTDKWDLHSNFSRIVIRVYPIRNILSAAGTIVVDAPPAVTDSWQTS
jgi:hypothetical protein